MEHVLTGFTYMWENRDLFYEGQHGSRPGYSCGSQIIIICHDISESLDEAARLEAIIVNFLKAFVLVLHNRLLKKSRSLGRGFKGGRIDEGISN